MKGRATVGLDDFKGQNKDELSMIEVARAILQDSGKRMAFAVIMFGHCVLGSHMNLLMKK